jgi:hypothetical protein
MKTKILTQHEAIYVYKEFGILNPNDIQHFSEKDIDNNIIKLTEEKKKLLWRWILWYFLNTELNKIYDNDTTKKIIKGVEEYLSENTSFTVGRVYNLFSESVLKSVLKDEVMNMMIELKKKEKKRTLGDDEPITISKTFMDKLPKNAEIIIEVINNVLELINLDLDNLERRPKNQETLQMIKDLKYAFETKYIDILYIITKAQSNYRQFLILEGNIKQFFIPIIRKRIIYRLQLRSVDDLINTSDDLITKKFPDDERNRHGGRRNDTIIIEQRNRLIRLRDELKELTTNNKKSTKRSSSSGSRK